WSFRTTPRKARASRRQLHRSHGRNRTRRGGRYLGDVPDRCGKQSQSCPSSLCPAGGFEMIAALIRWSARNVFLVGLATVFVTFAGIFAVSRVPLDAIPDLSDVQVIVYTEYPG